jgi:hypothetical protein
MYIINN